MAERKNLSKKKRFEVFKRDSFRCQYCGRSAPDVILEVDHIIPVAEGGKDDILNLITSCRDCNRGKGKWMLSESEVLLKQKEELDALNERREQMELMIKWKAELLSTEKKQVDSIDELIQQLTNDEFSLSDTGRLNTLKYIKRFSFTEVYEATEISFLYYYKGDHYSFNHAFNKIGGVCYNRRKQGDANNGNL